MNVGNFEDRLEPLGIATGVLLVLVGIGTVVGAPWTTADSTVAAGIQVLGAVLAAAVGVALAVLSRT